MKKNNTHPLIALTLLLTVLFLSLCFSPSMAAAQSLEELKSELAKYQREPITRSNALLRESMEMRNIEAGIARQHDIPVTRVLRYNLMLDTLVNYYYSIYFLQKNETTSASILDDSKLAEMIAAKPPYSFLFYLDIIKDVENIRQELNKYRAQYEKAKTRSQSIAEERAKLERDFRLNTTTGNTSGRSTFYLNWNLQEIKIKLEQSFVDETFNNMTLSTRNVLINETQDKLSALEAVLNKVRGSIKFSAEDYEYLDSKIYRKTNQILQTVQMLDSKQEKLSKQNSHSKKQDELSKYIKDSEKQSVEDEVLFLLDLMQNWSSMRLGWRAMEELLQDKLNPGEQEALLASTVKFIDDCDDDIRFCNKAILFIKEAESEVETYFENDDNFSDEDYRTRYDFLINLTARKNRFLSYLLELETMQKYALQLKEEINIIMGKNTSENVIVKIWLGYLSDLMDFELWHFGDNPVTVYSLFRALLTFAAGLTLTHYLILIFKRRAGRKGRISENTALIIQKIMNYSGFIISSILGLWALRIPLAAFAFLGGAAAISVGFGTQKIMGDFISGLLIIFSRKIRVGDEIIIGDERGTVREITIQNTIMRCQDSRELIIPNSKIKDSSIVNLTFNDSIVRTEVAVSVSYENDIKKVTQIINDILKNDHIVIKSRYFRVFFEEFENFSIRFTAQFFIDIKLIDERVARGGIRNKILEHFEEEKIKMPAHIGVVIHEENDIT